ncbi:hypothetical protein V1291_001904 [Nitrobacteraceae bacterium AZCC 1564]
MRVEEIQSSGTPSAVVGAQFMPAGALQAVSKFKSFQLTWRGFPLSPTWGGVYRNAAPSKPQLPVAVVNSDDHSAVQDRSDFNHKSSQVYSGCFGLPLKEVQSVRIEHEAKSIMNFGLDARLDCGRHHARTRLHVEEDLRSEFLDDIEAKVRRIAVRRHGLEISATVSPSASIC